MLSAQLPTFGCHQNWVSSLCYLSVVHYSTRWCVYYLLGNCIVITGCFSFSNCCIFVHIVASSVVWYQCVVFSRPTVIKIWVKLQVQLSDKLKRILAALPVYKIYIWFTSCIKLLLDKHETVCYIGDTEQWLYHHCGFFVICISLTLSL